MMVYLTMMAVRLVELQRVLKPTGTLYLHCDPAASHYLKILLDIGAFRAACGADPRPSNCWDIPEGSGSHAAIKNRP